MNKLSPEREIAVRFPRISRLWGQLRSGEIAEWPSADRSLFISVVVLLLYLYPAGLATYLTTSGDLPRYFDPAGVTLLQQASYLTVALWALLALASLLGRRRLSNSAWFVHLPIQYFAFNSAFFSYLLGPLTTPFFGLTLIGGMLVSYPLFGRAATFWGAGSMVFLVVGASFAEQSGLIPYGPLLRDYPVDGGTLSTTWLIGLGSFELIALGLALLLAVLLFDQERARADRLLRINEDLLEAHGEQERLARELRLARAKLESRVRERTRALSSANRDLAHEAERADRVARELQALSAAMEQAIEGIAHVGPDGRFKTVNSAFAAMHAAPVELLVGTLADDWVDPGDLAQVRAATRRILDGEKGELEVRGRTSAGDAFNERLVLVGEEAGGELTHYRFARDVTRQRDMTEQLTRASKMDAIGRLTGGIAHEFNNLLTAIISSGEQLRDRLEGSGNDEEIDRLLDWVTVSARRAADLTGRLLAFSHEQPMTPSVVDLELSIRGIIQMLERIFDTGISIECELPEDPPQLWLDVGRFESSLMNLAINARDSMRNGGCLRFSVREFHHDPGDSGFAAFQMAEGRFIQIDVSDTGAGIPTEILPKIWDPFFTTKDVGQGTGLGLSLVYNFVRESGGAVEVESQVGMGTTVSMFLPVGDAVDKGRRMHNSEATRIGTETILIAEDEPIVAGLLTRILSGHGYRVIGCVDGHEAVESFRKHRDEVALVLVDLRMPRLDGVEVFDEVQKIAPGAPVILMSGNTAGPEVEELKAKGLRRVIGKPYRQSEMLDVIRSVLDEQALFRH